MSELTYRKLEIWKNIEKKKKEYGMGEEDSGKTYFFA